MQNFIKTRLTRLGSAFAFAALTGCSSMPTQTIVDEKNCMFEEKNGGTVLAIPYNSTSGKKYSRSCREGEAAAKIAYLGKNEQGQLNWKSALTALAFDKEVKENIKASQEKGDQEQLKHYTQMKESFDSNLKKMGGLTIEDILNYVKELRARNSGPVPKSVPICTGTGAIRSCPADPAP